jgi:hypothetical protein
MMARIDKAEDGSAHRSSARSAEALAQLPVELDRCIENADSKGRPPAVFQPISFGRLLPASRCVRRSRRFVSRDDIPRGELILTQTPELEAKKRRAFELATEFLARLQREYGDKNDEAQAIMVLVVKFINKYAIQPPDAFLAWLVNESQDSLKRALEVTTKH